LIAYCVTNHNVGDLEGSQEVEVETSVLGFARIITVLLSPRTFPHLLLLILASTSLFQLVKIKPQHSEYIAIAFISFSFSYVIIALAARKQRWTDLVNTTPFKETETKGASAWFIHQFQQLVKVWIPPLLLTAVASVGLFALFGRGRPLESWSGGLPLALAFLFIAWSMGQAVSFRMTVQGVLIGRPSFVDSKVRQPHLISSSVMQVTIVQVAGFAMMWAIQSAAAASNIAPLQILKEQYAYLLVLAAGQISILVWARPSREYAGQSKGGAKSSFSIGLMMQLFAAWHLLSIWRRISDFGEPEVISTIEELTLMVLTVVLAIYGLSSRSLQVDSPYFSEKNALFWGLVFGFGYAGSITMITIMLSDVATVLMFGHGITYLTLLHLHRKTLMQLPWDAPQEPESVITDIKKKEEIVNPEKEISEVKRDEALIEEKTLLEDAEEEEIKLVEESHEEEEIEELEEGEEIEIIEDEDEEIEILN
jgi:hypothetical protein